MKALTLRQFVVALLLMSLVVVQQPALASPFGQGLFSADVPFGSQTSLSIALGGNVSITMTPSGSEVTGTGSHTLTVTTTDVTGYELYAYSPSSSDMVNGADVIPASGNSSPAALAANSWGYNTDGSSNYVGMLTIPSLIKETTGPAKNGDSTTVTYAARAGIAKGAGDYAVGVVYTAVAKNK